MTIWEDQEYIQLILEGIQIAFMIMMNMNIFLHLWTQGLILLFAFVSIPFHDLFELIQYIIT